MARGSRRNRFQTAVEESGSPLQKKYDQKYKERWFESKMNIHFIERICLKDGIIQYLDWSCWFKAPTPQNYNDNRFIAPLGTFEKKNSPEQIKDMVNHLKVGNYWLNDNVLGICKWLQSPVYIQFLTVHREYFYRILKCYIFFQFRLLAMIIIYILSDVEKLLLNMQNFELEEKWIEIYRRYKKCRNLKI